MTVIRRKDLVFKGCQRQDFSAVAWARHFYRSDFMSDLYENAIKDTFNSDIANSIIEVWYKRSGHWGER